MKKFVGILGSASFLLTVGCVQPVKRSSDADMPHLVSQKLDPNVVKKRLWILEFDAKAYASRKGSSELKQAHVAEILQSSLLKVFSRPDSPYVTSVSEDGGYLEAHADSSTPAEDIQRLARESGVSGFMKGTLIDVQIHNKGGREGLLKSSTKELSITVEFEMYDGVTGRKVYAGRAQQAIEETQSGLFVDSTDGFEDLNGKLEQVTQQLAEKMLSRLSGVHEKLGWMGRVVKLDGPRVYLNAGRKTGLQVGDILKVVDRPKEVVDPQTGAVVGEAPGRLKATLKVIDYFGIDGSMAVLLSGGGVNPGDSVELN